MTKTSEHRRKGKKTGKTATKTVATDRSTYAAERAPEAKGVATQQVFGVAELLEEILTYLPMKDLLLDQRVCRGWRATVTGSPRLQRALFFMPVDNGVDKADLNDVVVYIADQWLQDPPANTQRILRYTYLNPLFEEHFGIETIADEIISGQLKHSACRSGRLKEASWRRMLSFQPPLENLSGVVKGLEQQEDSHFGVYRHDDRSKAWLRKHGLCDAMVYAGHYECGKDLEDIKKVEKKG